MGREKGRRGEEGGARLGSARAGRPLPRVPPRSAAPAAVLPERPEAGGGAPPVSPRRRGAAREYGRGLGAAERGRRGAVGAAALAVCEQ